jgi:hypothetical protein
VPAVWKTDAPYEVDFQPGSVDAGALTQACYLILHLQLATLQFRQLEIVRGRMLKGVVYFVFKHPVPLFEFRKMRCGHISGLLASDCSLTTKF